MIEGKQTQTSIEVRLQLQDIIYIPLAALVAVCLYTLINYGGIGSLTRDFDMSTLITIPTLLVMIFGITFLYKSARRQYRHMVAKVAAAILSLYCVIAFLFAFAPGPEAFSFYFKLAIILFNPATGQILTVTAIIGMVFLLIRKKR